MGTVSAGAGWVAVAVNASDFTSAVYIYFRVMAFNQYGRTVGDTLVLPGPRILKPVTPVPPTAAGTDQGK